MQSKNGIICRAEIRELERPKAWLYPGSSLELSNQPYFVVPQ